MHSEGLKDTKNLPLLHKIYQYGCCAIQNLNPPHALAKHCVK